MKSVAACNVRQSSRSATELEVPFDPHGAYHVLKSSFSIAPTPIRRETYEIQCFDMKASVSTLKCRGSWLRVMGPIGPVTGNRMLDQAHAL